MISLFLNDKEIKTEKHFKLNVTEVSCSIIFVWFGFRKYIEKWRGIKIRIRRKTLILWDYFINFVVRSPQGKVITRSVC